MRPFLCFFVVLLFLSCNEKITEEGKESSLSGKLVLKEEKVFVTGFEDKASIDKVYLIDNEEFVDYGSTQTYKKIVLHSLTSEKKYEIPLDEVLKREARILHYDIVNLDTVVLIAAYTNRMYFMNSLGHIWKTLNLNSVFSNFENEKYRFEAGGVFRPFLYNDSSLIVTVVPCLKKPELPFSFSSYYAELNDDTLPYLFKINNIFSDSLEHSFGLNNFYHRFSTVKDYPYGRNHLSFGNNKLLIKENSSDSLYVVNPTTLTVDTVVLIESDFISAKIKYPMVSLEEVDNGYDINKRMRESPYLAQNICFSEKFQKYFLSIHQPNEDFFVVCVYNTSFIKTAEIKLSEAKYGAFKCLTINSEIVVSDYKKYSDRDDFFEINSLSLFEYVEK